MSQVEEPPAFSPMTGPDAGLARLGPDVAAAISAYVSRGPFGVAVFDTDLRFLLVSEGLAALHGQEASSTIGKTIDEVLPPPFGALVSRPLREALETGNPILGVNTWGTFDDPGAPRSFTSSFYRLDDARGMAVGVVVLLTETTELRYAETAARSATDQLALLQEVTETLSSADDAIDVTRAVLTGAAQAVGASAAVIMALDPGSDNLVHLASSGLSDATLSYLEAIAPLAAELPHSDALRTRSLTTWSSRAERDAKYPALRSISADHQSWAFVPLLSRDGGVGVVAFAWRIDRHFPEADLAVLAAVGRQCGLALEQARILDAERESRRATAFLVEVTRFVVEGLDAGVFAISNGNRILTFNQRFCSLLGFEDVELGGDAVALLEPCLALVADPNTVRHHLGACRSTPAATIEVDIDLTDGRVISCTSSPIFDRRGIVLGRVWYIRDVTETRAHEAERRLVQDELLASHGQQAFLLEAAELVAQGESYDDTVQRLASAAVPVLADLCLVDAFTMDGRLVRMAARHADPRLQPLADELSSKYAPDPSGNHPSVDVIDTGRPRWSESMSDDFLRRTSRDEEHFTLLKRLGFTSYMALPLIADNHILGSVTLVSAGSGRRFGQRDLALAEEFTSRVAQVVATAHRNESDRHAAHTLQA
ncbi:MAG: PAS domain-containing protein, partial [Acidimicrobiales bacterium]